MPRELPLYPNCIIKVGCYYDCEVLQILFGIFYLRFEIRNSLVTPDLEFGILKFGIYQTATGALIPGWH
jgi:hypothetical protein